jgi:DNA-binding CsgD family transcriptional regulator
LVLVGRDSEHRFIENLLEDASNGASAALVIRGEAGIGKSAVLEQVAQGSGMRTLRCTGVESEHDLPFAGLEQLFRSAHDMVERLPGPQAAALRSAFGLSGDRVDDRLLVGLATLNLLAEASEDAPLLCLVDDLQWLDGPSAQALLFAARRLDAEGVVMLFAVRDGPADWFDVAGVQQLTLEPLPEPAAREVLATRRGARLSRAAQRRLLREAAGNPLALLELPAQDTDGQATGIEASFRARVLRLPHETRCLLLAAALNTGEAGTWAELGRLAGLPMAQHPAVDAGLIGKVDAIVFRHPLVRSAVHNSSSPAERAEAHRLLASGATDPLSRAEHLAAAARQPDEALATELAEAAAAAARRGAFGSAASALVRAADLSTDVGARTRRLISAAQAYLEAGDADASSRMADEALADARTVSDQAAITAIKSALELQQGTPGAAYDLLRAAAHAISGEDPALALHLQAQAIIASFVAGWPERAFTEAHEFVKNLPPTSTPYEQFLRAFLGAMTAGGEAKDAVRGQLLEALAGRTPPEDFRFVAWAALACAYLGDLSSSREFGKRAVASARAAGSFNTLPQALLGLARLALTVRDVDEAEECAKEGTELTRQFGQENQETCFGAILVRCLAARGQIEECRELGEATLRRALAHGITVAADDVRLGMAELELSLAHGAAARDLIEAISLPLASLTAAPYLAEAALLSGDCEPPHTAIDALADYAEQAQDPLVLGLVARSRALLAASANSAESLFLEAVRYQTEHTQPYERARTALAYGEFLRRAQRRMEARVQLRDALATFEGLNTPLWAERARAELEATGIIARKRDPSTLDMLTPQELRIAKLVAGGTSNRDVASQLFLSPKTVEYHLRKVFVKLGVSSRVELASLPLAPVAVGATDC